MRSPQPNPWAQVGLIAGIAALVGAGVGAGGALSFAERRLEGLRARVDALESRMVRIEAGSDRS